MFILFKFFLDLWGKWVKTIAPYPLPKCLKRRQEILIAFRLTCLLDKRQTKSCFKDINILIWKLKIMQPIKKKN